MERKKILITVTTYPLPSNKYQELVCTAGLTEKGEWIRIYPVPLSKLVNNRFRKYYWIEINLKKRDSYKDFRPESFNPVDASMSDLKILDQIKTKSNWLLRKELCLKNVYISLTKLIEDAYDKDKSVSLATYKPKRIVDFVIEEDERDWKKEWKEQMKQLCLFTGEEFEKLDIKKVPYKFSYRFIDEDGTRRKIMIEDWEIGQLYWNCIKTSASEEEALKKVRARCWDYLVEQCDLHFFLGTTLQWHRRKGSNPFVIIGLFYPQKEKQLKLF
ncbi:hypothetical protein [Flavilitoribacter nigricans]|uniref:Uncharacterized protein n=1 Tax=Flavilitoribacter nigricans (strain ATCC 23147 / DSM 23189 / NBRC 102662 / NCIMB 1420 / SS-2) TaxID=1122177 RepID=A0A2D0N382_FLAN2|nr:hypothetical protein [Flavilitoribacter nigricans]PHN03002.1 hypothetical protein CRP01_29810 [Flavilitoribacter nigricans DSM 23189 = NBRC 102662]